MYMFWHADLNFVFSPSSLNSCLMLVLFFLTDAFLLLPVRGRTVKPDRRVVPHPAKVSDDELDPPPRPPGRSPLPDLLLPRPLRGGQAHLPRLPTVQVHSPRPGSLAARRPVPGPTTTTLRRQVNLPRRPLRRGVCPPARDSSRRLFGRPQDRVDSAVVSPARVEQAEEGHFADGKRREQPGIDCPGVGGTQAGHSEGTAVNCRIPDDSVYFYTVT